MIEASLPRRTNNPDRLGKELYCRPQFAIPRRGGTCDSCQSVTGHTLRCNIHHVFDVGHSTLDCPRAQEDLGVEGLNEVPRGRSTWLGWMRR